jgi:hypothetical protein
MNAIELEAGAETRHDGSFFSERRLLIWSFFLLGMALGICAVYFLIAQPVRSQLSRLENQLAAMESSIEVVAGERDKAWSAGHLLSDLRSLEGQFDGARRALREIRELRNELIEEGEQTRAAIDALANLTRLQNFALAQEEQTNSARVAVSEMSEVQQRLIDEHVATPKAAETLADLERVRRDLAELLAIKSQIASQAADVAVAKSAAGDLVALKNDIVAGSDNLETARITANRMFVIQGELKSQADELHDAFQSLDRLVDLKDKLIDQTPDLSDAIQNLELLADFREEMGEQIRSLSQIRDSLMQIAMMESYVGKVAKLIEPLAQISNVRRLSEQDLRAAARSILDNRATRLGSNRDALQEIPREATNDPFLIPGTKPGAGTEIPRDEKVPDPVPFPVTNP